MKYPLRNDMNLYRFNVGKLLSVTHRPHIQINSILKKLTSKNFIITKITL